MSQRTNHPLKTLSLLLIVGVIGWGAYEFVYKRGLLRPEPSAIVQAEQTAAVRDAILDVLDDDRCLQTLDEISYRANEHHYRIRITVSSECEAEAREMCEQIAELGSNAVDVTVGVFAYDAAGNLLAKFVQ